MFPPIPKINPRTGRLYIAIYHDQDSRVHEDSLLWTLCIAPDRDEIPKIPISIHSFDVDHVTSYGLVCFMLIGYIHRPNQVQNCFKELEANLRYDHNPTSEESIEFVKECVEQIKSRFPKNLVNHQFDWFTIQERTIRFSYLQSDHHFLMGGGGGGGQDFQSKGGGVRENDNQNSFHIPTYDLIKEEDITLRYSTKQQSNPIIDMMVKKVKPLKSVFNKLTQL